MIYASLCAGINAPRVAWTPLGFTESFSAEIDPFCRALLDQKYTSPNLGNVYAITERKLSALFKHRSPPSLVIFGSPCQSFSFAGRRAGMDDPRGNVTLACLRVVGIVKPRWILFENVPGLLSIDRGKTFEAILGTMAKLGYGVAYRILDAQYYGVPQRRRRVFIVGYLGDWRRAATVLFEPGCLQGDIETGQEKREEIASTLGGGTGEKGWRDDLDRMTFIPILEAGARTGRSTDDIRAGIGIGEPGDPMFTLQSGKQHAIAFNLRGREGGSQAEETDLASLRASSGGSSRSYVAQTLNAGGHSRNPLDEPLIVGALPSGGTPRGHGTSGVNDQAVNAGHIIAFSSTDHGADAGGLSPTLRSMGHAAIMQSSVRRLTPIECERLQGFPNNYTRIWYPHNKYASDGPRYRAIGNSMAVPVIRWIGRRIQLVDSIE